MPYNPAIHHRHSIRLRGYDYSREGLYFITICVQDRACLFGKIENGEMNLNDAGKMVETEWLKLPNRFTNIELHEYMVMPNHFHAILEIVGTTVGATLVVALNNNPVAQNDTCVTDNGRPQTFAIDNGRPQTFAIDNGRPQTFAIDNGRPQTFAIDNGRPQTFAIDNGRPQGHAPTDTAKNKTVGDMMDAFKSITTVEYIRGVKTFGWQRFSGKIWQRNYYEHIIRDEQSYQRISEYIINNPAKWADDKLYKE
jgi:REP element-mobilizing transposase RayT